MKLQKHQQFQPATVDSITDAVRRSTYSGLESFARVAADEYERIRSWRIGVSTLGKSRDFIEAKANDYHYRLGLDLIAASLRIGRKQTLEFTHSGRIIDDGLHAPSSDHGKYRADIAKIDGFWTLANGLKFDPDTGRCLDPNLPRIRLDVGTIEAL